MMDGTHEWCSKWGFKMVLAKTLVTHSVVLFHRTKNKTVKVCFKGTALKGVDKIKFYI